MEKIIMLFIIAAAITLFATPMVKKLAIRYGAVDIPKDARRVHKKPMPLMGGLAIYTAIVIASLIFIPIDKALFSTLIGGTIILISGIIDDVKDLSPKAKILFQVIAGLVLILGGIRIDGISNPFSQTGQIIPLNGLSIPITIFWIVGITNTVNLIDGLDGLAAGVTMIASLSFLFVANKLGYIPIIIMSSIVAGACFGFLPYNLNPAKIFMGDTGALFLGFILASLSIEGVMKSVATLAIVVPILILGVPIFDATLAIFRRLLKGKSIVEADKDHLHHKLLKLGFSQNKTVIILYLISGIFGVLAVIMTGDNSKRVLVFFIAIFIIILLIAKRIGIIGRKEEDGDG